MYVAILEPVKMTIVISSFFSKDRSLVLVGGVDRATSKRVPTIYLWGINMVRTRVIIFYKT